MTDTASLVARVKTDGVTEFNKQLDTMTTSAGRADKAVNDLIPDLNRTNTAAGKTASDGFAKFRNSAGQVGYQIQDLVVQLQSGQSAFVAIGQQGSQLAGAFGPGGAVLGAVIALASAVGGVLYNSLGNSKSNMEAIEKAATDLSASFQVGKDGTIELSDAMMELANNGDTAYNSMVRVAGLQAEQQVKKTTEALSAQNSEWLNNADATAAAGAVVSNFLSAGQNTSNVLQIVGDNSAAAAEGLTATANSATYLAAKYGVAETSITALLAAQREFESTKTPEAAQKIADSMSAIAKETTNSKEELLTQAIAAQKLASALDLATQQLNKASSAQNNAADAANRATKAYQEQTDGIIKQQQIQTLGERDKAKAIAELDKKAFAERKGVSDAQIAEFNAARDKETANELKAIDDRESKKAERTDAAASRKEEAQAKRDERELQRQQKQADDFLAQVERQNGDELAQIDATEKQKLAKLDEYHNQHLISDTEFESARTAIQLTAEDQRQKEIDKRREEAARKQGKHDQYIAEIQGLNATELEMIDAQTAAKEAKAKEYRDRGIISEKEYATAIEEIHKQSEKKKNDVYIGALGDMTSNLKTALGENNALYKAAAITQTIIETYKGAQAAFSALAPIPIVGPALGTAAAAAAIGAGMARIAAIRSAREQGGTLSAGQYSTIAERNKPEVIMPAGASRVRTAQQMRQIMGENAGNSSSANNGVIIVNNTSARIDTATTERDDEGRLRVIIRELVSSDLQDSNSSISKSRRATRGMAGF